MVRAMWWIAGAAWAAVPYAGLEWRPFGRGDLAWVEDGRTTGLGVGEGDGAVHPALSAFFGDWITPRFALQGSVGVARLTSTTWVGEVWEQRHWGVIRPELDARVALLRPTEGWPLPWVLAGAYADVPSARETSNGYDEVEQEEADLLATADRALLSGVGGRIGLGADLRVHPAFAIGASYTIGLHRSLYLGDDPTIVTTWVAGEASILATFLWDRAARDPGP
jgi:hypothetical protein